MHRLIVLGSLLCVLSSSQRKIPANLLEQDQMVSILVDLALAEAMVGHYANDKNTACWLLEKNAYIIYQAYGTDVITFQESYQYYLSHFEKMRAIYALVIARIEELPEQP